VVTVVVPRPSCVLLDIHQWQRIPSDELHHNAKATSWVRSSNTTEGHARPPMLGSAVVATTRDWELNLKSRL
jgi:hypothetical protein